MVKGLKTTQPCLLMRFGMITPKAILLRRFCGAMLVGTVMQNNIQLAYAGSDVQIMSSFTKGNRTHWMIGLTVLLKCSVVATKR